MSSYFDKPTHWRMRAEMTRTIAAGMGDVEGRRLLYSIAADYDKMAQRLESDARQQVRRTMPEPARNQPASNDLSERLVELQRKWQR